ncbi:glycosyltransferase [Bacillus sp. IITD106]|nr:glycosyltransferase [Bacillus sp. IITD106]
MNNIIVYFPYKLSNNPKSGSGVRPIKMIEAFRAFGTNNGIEIIVISGESGLRKKKIKQFMNSGKVKNTLFCYMENSTTPYWLTNDNHIPKNPFIDYKFWKYLKRNNVSIGLFYRDIYWKFKEFYVLKGIKKLVTPLMKKLYYQELSTYQKVVDILYLPSLEMNEFVEWPGKISGLPPGIDRMKIAETQNNHADLNLVYVGAINDEYGMNVLLQALDKVNQTKKVQLFLVCRENEYEQNEMLQKYSDKPWFIVQHLSGAELEKLYENVNVGVIPRKKSIYHDFSMPVKLFEYLSFGLPLLVTNCDAQAMFVSENEYGIVTEDNVDEFSRGILTLTNMNTYKRYQDNILNTAYNKQSWYARVEKLYNDLTN